MTDQADGTGCQHVDFSDDDPEQCGRDCEPVVIGNVTTWLCPEHAALARNPTGTSEVPA